MPDVLLFPSEVNPADVKLTDGSATGGAVTATAALALADATVAGAGAAAAVGTGAATLAGATVAGAGAAAATAVGVATLAGATVAGAGAAAAVGTGAATLAGATVAGRTAQPRRQAYHHGSPIQAARTPTVRVTPEPAPAPPPPHALLVLPASALVVAALQAAGRIFAVTKSDTTADPAGPFVELLVTSPGTILAQLTNGSILAVVVDVGNLILASPQIARVGAATSAGVEGVRI